MVQAYSVGQGKRSTDAPPQAGPGPGAYNPEKKQKAIPPSYKIPQSQRQAFNPNSTPGPGTYGGSDGFKGPKFSFAGKKQESIQSYQPGPGAYNPRINKQAPNYTFGGKYSSWQDSVQPPGPGTYDSHMQLDAPSSKFGRSTRDRHEQEYVPGPGQYEPKWTPETAPKYRFGTGLRKELYDSELKKNPGPGSYDHQSVFESNQQKGFTLISRRNIPNQDCQSMPGPGAYNPQRMQRPPSCKIGKSARSTMGLGFTPGPGEYEPQMNTIRPQSAQIKLGSAVRRPLNECVSNPGPGSYEIQSKAIEGPKVSILGHKYDPIQNQKDQVPGPGTYERPIMQRPQSAKIGTAKRNELTGFTDQPGPGQYKLGMKKDGPSWGFGSSNRPPLNPKNDTPGPGGYDPQGGIGNIPQYAVKGINNK